MAGPDSFVIAGTKSSISTLFCVVGDSAFWSISLHSPLVDETLLMPIGLLLTAAATAATVAIDTDLGGLAPVPVTVAPNDDMMFSNLLMCTGDVGVVATSIGDMLRLMLEGISY